MLDAEINTLKFKYDTKRLEIAKSNQKLQEKMKVLAEAHKAYSKVNCLNKVNLDCG